MNPTQNEYQSLLISSATNKADLRFLLGACEDYMLNLKIAEKIISEMVEVVKTGEDWRYDLEYLKGRWICLVKCWMNATSR